MKFGQAVSEKKTFKDFDILYMYIAQGQGQMTPRDKIFVVTRSICYFDHTLQVSATGLHFEKLNFQYFPHTNA